MDAGGGRPELDAKALFGLTRFGHHPQAMRLRGDDLRRYARAYTLSSTKRERFYADRLRVRAWRRGGEESAEVEEQRGRARVVFFVVWGGIFVALAGIGTAVGMAGMFIYALAPVLMVNGFSMSRRYSLRVLADLGFACDRCGYDVTGLEEGAVVCPECGTALRPVEGGGRGDADQGEGGLSGRSTTMI